ncbi:isoprenoid synthase domain-containing protein [Dipodascopsis uninucleata]
MDPKTYGKCKQIILNYCHNRPFISKLQYKILYEKEIEEYILSLDISPRIKSNAKFFAFHGVVAACCFYRYFIDRLPDYVYLIAKYTALIVALDDTPEILAEIDFGLKEFNEGKEISSTLIRELFKHNAELCTYYDAYGASALTASTLHYVSTLLVEPTLKIRFVSDEMAFFFRWKTAITEAYLQFLFPLKALEHTDINYDYINLIPLLGYHIGAENDVLSFYKESMAGKEFNTRMWLEATRYNGDVSKALDIISSKSLKSFKEAIALTEDMHPVIKQIVLEYSEGYCAFHFICTRYRMQELTPNVLTNIGETYPIYILDLEKA